MREIRIKFSPRCLIELPADVPITTLEKLLKGTSLKVRWNSHEGYCGKKGYLEIYRFTTK